MRKTLNIIGCGKLGSTLARLWAERGGFEINDVLNRSPSSAQSAVSFIGSGRPIDDYSAMRPADVTMIATPDDQIADSCDALAASGLLQADGVVFHCSGALPSSILAAATAAGATVASAHPIKSFADPQQAILDFPGTFCGVEGDPPALAILTEAFTMIGARVVGIDAAYKSVYHAAAVFASNYLVTLLDVAVQAYVKAGVPNEVALQSIEPLVRGTVDNVFRLGPTAALTGPIARGDIATAVKQYRAVNAWDQRYGALYKQLAKLTSDVVARKRFLQNES